MPIWKETLRGDFSENKAFSWNLTSSKNTGQQQERSSRCISWDRVRVVTICAGSLEAPPSDIRHHHRMAAGGCCTTNPSQKRARISAWLHFCQFQVRLGTVCKCSQVQSCTRFLNGFEVHRPVASLPASGASQDPARIMNASAPCQIMHRL